MTQSLITGGCYCGAVRFQAPPPPLYQTNCHCSNCRRAIGAQSVAWITVNRADFRLEKGAPTRFRTDTGAWRTFCGRCGTSLTYERDSRPDEVDITTGSLDYPDEFRPTKEFYTDEKVSWVAVTAKVQC